MGWTTGVRFPTRGGDFSVLTEFRLAVGPTQPPIQWGPGCPSPGVEWPGRESDHSPPPSANVKNGGAIPPLPIRLIDLALFTFTFYELKCDPYDLHSENSNHTAERLFGLFLRGLT
jgi:hypothetical protein